MIQREVERAGVTTVSLSLVREFTEKVQPPRALWVPFPFGRPLGAPGNPSIQRRVLRAALELLARSNGPVLEEFGLAADEEHLEARWQTVGRSCGPRGCSLDQAVADPVTPVELPKYGRSLGDLLAEIAALADAHRRYRRAHGGRTQVGSSGASPEGVAAAAETVHRFVVGEPVVLPAAAPTTSPRLFVRLSIDDLKAYYLEAKIGESPEVGAENAAEANDWLWLETQAGRLMIAARDRLVETTDRREDPNWVMARGIVPRGYGASGYLLDHVTDPRAVNE